MKLFSRFIPILLTLISLFAVTGCNDDDDVVENILDPITGSSRRVAHQNWDSYNLYTFRDGTWTPVISQGDFVADLPPLGDRPTLIVHGLGSDIASGRFNNLATGLQQSGATAIFGFEYDTLDSINKNGNFLLEALGLIATEDPGETMRIVAHSAGVLVTRVALESGVPLAFAPNGNRAVLVAGPNLGTELATELQDRPDLVEQALGNLILHGRLEFRNANRDLVRVTGQEQGFTDLRPDSAFLAGLNFEAANHHPQWEYRTLAGSERSTDYETLNRILGTFLSDGLVDVPSALAPVIGAVDQEILGFDHSAIVESADPVAAILAFLGF